MSVSDDHSEDDLLQSFPAWTLVAISSVPQMSRGLGRRQPAAHPLDNRTSARATIHTNFKFNKLTVTELCPMSINYVQCPSTALLAFLRSIFLVMTAFLRRI